MKAWIHPAPNKRFRLCWCCYIFLEHFGPHFYQLNDSLPKHYCWPYPALHDLRCIFWWLF